MLAGEELLRLFEKFNYDAGIPIEEMDAVSELDSDSNHKITLNEVMEWLKKVGQKKPQKTKNEKKTQKTENEKKQC